MPDDTSSTNDKNVVDLTRKHRNKAVSRTVRTTRERLQSGHSGAPALSCDILVAYVQSVLNNAAVMPFLVLLVGGIGTYVSSSSALAAWTLFTLSIHGLNILLARKAGRSEITPLNLARWTRLLILSQCAMGVCWALFSFQECDTCGNQSFLFYKGAVLLVVLSVTAMSNILLRRAVLFAFIPTVAALVYQVMESRDPFVIGMTATVTTALIFFIHITDRLYQNSLSLSSFQSEKDDLIAELEVAKSMSDEARRRAEEANMAKSRFLASMSHELRTPLNAILGFSEVMANEVLGPLNNALYKEYSGDIHRSGQHLLNLINEILDLSRIEAGKYELNEGSLNLLELAEDCLGMVQLRARAKNISVSHQFEPALPQVWADEKAMRQVVLNLLSNAVKFTPQGGEIMLKVGWTAGGGQYVAIRDNGPGIAEDEIPVVLSAFGQGSIAIKSAEQGTGLGLPIVQAILAKHGGEFKLKSKLREGTEVIAILPPSRVLQTLPAFSETQAVEPRKRHFA